MGTSWFLGAILVIGVIAFFFSRLAANRGGSKKNSYQDAEMGSSGFMFVDSGSGYSSEEDSDDDEGDDGDGDDGYDFTDDGGSYDGGGDSYDSGGDSSSSE
ncbi:MAG: hypothetical protein L6R45_14780 [Anaerolineae bacterium]|nr:hypothetical protein [Anaerolineae bacterium]